MAGTYTNVGYVGGPNTQSLGASSLGANDAVSRGSAYLVEEFATAGAGPESQAFVSGTGNLAVNGTAGQTLSPGELSTHPGVAAVSTVAVGYAQIAAYNSNVFAHASSPAVYTWNVCFRTPNIVSTATDAYNFYVGCSNALAGNYPGYGAGIAYTHSKNGGNWQTYTAYPANEVEQDTNTSAVFTPAMWNNMQVVLSQGKFSFYLNGTFLNTLTDGSMTGTTLWQMSAGGIAMVRSAIGGTPATAYALIDRASCYITGLGR